MIGDRTVPIGSYTRQILDTLGITTDVMKNVVSQETDVKGIVTKVALGEADAGFVYLTDAKPVALRTRSIALPAWAQPPVRYELAVLKANSNLAAAKAFVKKVTSKRGRQLLSKAGFGRRSRRRLFAALLAVATAIALAFLLLPVAAIFLRVPPGDLIDALGRDVTRDALIVSIKTSAIAHAAVLLVGTPAAYFLAGHRFRGRGAVLTLIELPLVLPPAVAGIALFAAFGRNGLLGGELDALGVQIPFTQTAVVFAVAFVETPFYFRGAIAAFEAVDGTLVDAARTLGAGPARVFARIALPLAAEVSVQPRRWRSPEGSASSARPSSSRAACRG